MSFPESTQLLLKAKKEKGLTFADIGNLLGLDEVWVASLFYGQSTASDEESDQLLTTLGLGTELKEILTTPPVKGSLDPVFPTDPLIYRFYEIMQVY